VGYYGLYVDLKLISYIAGGGLVSCGLVVRIPNMYYEVVKLFFDNDVNIIGIWAFEANY
jgi:hypothetical protein